MRLTLIFIMIFINFYFVTGCVTRSGKILSTNTNALEIAKESFGANNDSLVGERYIEPQDDMIGYTRTASNEIKSSFKKLPNPTMHMYIYPHITKGGLGIMGYSVEFDMYKEDQYSLPGENGGWE